METTLPTEQPIDVDHEIQGYLKLENPKSFFLFAGAGSGKTRSLVTALLYIRDQFGNKLHVQGKKVAVITYTNAAADVIQRRIDFNPLFVISTIHSFVWTLIKPFPADIKVWLINNLQEEIEELYAELAKGRPGTKTEIARKASLAAKQRRLANLSTVTQFTYNPNGENAGKDALNHSEVVKIAANFLSTKPLLQHILISQYPILFIDESQDTNKHLMEAILSVELTHKGKFLLGLFGDTMQRIYLDGKSDLGVNLPPHWAKPSKLVNYRSPQRIIALINKIRLSVDGRQQIPAPAREEGFVRLFMAPNTAKNKDALEAKVQQQMETLTKDAEWLQDKSVKKLILEHHMAAHRLGFSEMFDILYSVDKFATGLLDGSLSIVKLFSELVLPLLLAKRKGDEFAVANILQKHSPLLDASFLKNNSEKQLNQLKKAGAAVNALYDAWHEKKPTFKEILDIVHTVHLFEVPTKLQPFLTPNEEGINVAPTNPPAADTAQETITEEETNDDLTQYNAIQAFLNGPFDQIQAYSDYIGERTPFDTHQGIKGCEFPRVMVIVDDAESRGSLYKYDKLFGAEPPSKTDLDNEKVGKDSGISRPKRLFYVTCSRAESSLAIVAYTSDVAAFQAFVINQGWFKSTEIELL